MIDILICLMRNCGIKILIVFIFESFLIRLKYELTVLHCVVANDGCPNNLVLVQMSQIGGLYVFRYVEQFVVLSATW